MTRNELFGSLKGTRLKLVELREADIGKVIADAAAGVPGTLIYTVGRVGDRDEQGREVTGFAPVACVMSFAEVRRLCDGAEDFAIPEPSEPA